MTPSGMRVQKMARQSRISIRTPPSTGPIETPTPTVPIMMPSACPRCAAGKLSVTIAAPLAITIEAAMACTVRPPSSSGSDPAMAESPVAAVKQAKPMM